MDLPPLPLQPACLFPGADRGAPSSAGSVLFCRVINRWSVLIFQPPERILAAAPSFREQGAWCLSCPDKDQPIPKISLSCHYPSLSGWPSQPTAPASPAPGSSLPRVWTRFLSSLIATVLQPSQRPGAPSREGPWPCLPAIVPLKQTLVLLPVNYIQCRALPGGLCPQIPGGSGGGGEGKCLCADSP